MLKFFRKILTPFSKMRTDLSTKLRTLFSRHKVDAALLEEMEQLFYEADLGATMAMELAEKVESFAKKKEGCSADEILLFLKEELKALFVPFPPQKEGTPHVTLVVGVNGSGKTTTLAKLALRMRKEGRSVLIAAADTFRAAAIEQLEAWAHKIDIPLIKSQIGSDPSAVVFDALTAAKARGTRVVLIDTAGRLQTKTDLMQELAKIRRVCQKLVEGAPHETLLVLDACIGQNALEVAKTFHQFTPITSIALTKLDGSAKGGIAIAIQKELKIPIRWAGLGERAEELIPFDPESYLNSLLGLNH